MSWVYQKSGRDHYEHWHLWTTKKTVKTKTGYEMLERCRGCGDLRSTRIETDANGDRLFTKASTKYIPRSDNGSISSPITQVNTPPTEDSQST